jgi:hypothetical protein
MVWRDVMDVLGSGPAAIDEMDNASMDDEMDGGDGLSQGKRRRSCAERKVGHDLT